MIPNARLTSPKNATPTRGLTLLAYLILPLLIASCSQSRPDVIDVVVTNPNAYQENHGPFDENGNYIESWADNPPKRRYISLEQYQQEQQKKHGKKHQYIAAAPPVQQPPAHVATNTPPQHRPQPQSYTPPKPVSQPKPKPTVVKAKPKPPAPRTHTVRKGDTLYALSRKYGTSVSAIQKANRISGSNIRIGQKLTIPR